MRLILVPIIAILRLGTRLTLRQSQVTLVIKVRALTLSCVLVAASTIRLEALLIHVGSTQLTLGAVPGQI